MVLQRKRRLFFGLGLALALVLAVACQPRVCRVLADGGEFSAEAGGDRHRLRKRRALFVHGFGDGDRALPGHVHRDGLGDGDELGGARLTLSASFTIHSGDFLITGTKNGGIGSGCQDSLGNTGGVIDGLSYQATIHTPTGDYADRGTSRAVLFTNASTTVLEEKFHVVADRADSDRADQQGPVQERRLERFPAVQESGAVRVVSLMAAAQRQHAFPQPLPRLETGGGIRGPSSLARSSVWSTI